jgi:NAD(P) transhydrogenase subunit alpha
MTLTMNRRFCGSNAIALAAALVWMVGALRAQPPDLPDLPGDIGPPSIDLGSSAEAQAEQARTQDQQTVVRNPKPVDLNQLVIGLTVFALATMIGLQIVRKLSPEYATAYLSGATAVSGVVVVAGLVTGTKVLAGTSKGHPVTLAALGFVAIVLAMINFTGGFGLTRRLVDEGKRAAWLALAYFFGLVVVEVALAQRVPQLSVIEFGGLVIDQSVAIPAADVAYLVAGLLAIVCLTGLAYPRTAENVEVFGVACVFLAIAVTIVRFQVLAPLAFGVAILIGAAVGIWLAIRTASAARPHVATLLGGICGLASSVVAGAGLLEEIDASYQFAVAAALAGALGGTVFCGSLIAYFKLQSYRRFAQPILVPAHRLVCFLVAAAVVALGVSLVQSSRQWDPARYAWVYVALVLAAAALAAIVVLPLRNDAMPAAARWLICLLGYSVAAIGFMLNHALLIIVGALIGASCMRWPRPRDLGNMPRPV